MRSVRLPVFLTVAALCVALALGAFARLGLAADGPWQTDFKAAQAKAKEQKKLLLVDFTGSDWCPPCMKLHNEVFEKEPFKAEAPKQFVLVELDFPQNKEQSDDLKEQNKGLAEKYKIRAFPSVLLLDAEGQVIARRTGFDESAPAEYLKELAGLPKLYQDVIALKAKLEKTQGLDRAKLLDQIVEGSQKLGDDSKEVTDWGKEIITLDPDNKAGLKVKYEFPLTLGEGMQLLQAGKAAEAQEMVDKALAMPGVSAEMRQKGYTAKAQVCLSEKKFADAVAQLKLAKEAAPQSASAKRLGDLIQQFSKVVEDLAAADKLEAGLAKAEGAERAQLLDKLIETKQQLLRYDPQAVRTIAKWTKEIVTLDADNKAGLKKKYQFKAALADADELMRGAKADEAAAALDKALETPGISADEIQQAQLAKARLAFMQHDDEQGVACLKKALEASPKSALVPRIKMMLRQVEQRKKAAPKKSADE